MLNLQEFEVIKKEENEYYYKFTVVAKDRPFVCTQCLWDELPIMGEDRKFIIHSSKEREITDIPIHGKPVKIILKHSRYKCPCCGKTFYQPFHCIERNDKVTLRLKHYIQQQSLRKPFLEVAYDCGLSHTSVRKYFKEQIEVLDKEDTLFYLDLPYIQDTRKQKKSYDHEMTDEQHKELVDVLIKIKGKVVLSGYDHPIYNKLLENGWNKVVLGEYAKRGQKTNEGELSKGKEFVWVNYKLE